MSIEILSSHAAAVAGASVAKARSNFVAKSGRSPRPLVEWMKKRKKTGAYMQGKDVMWFKNRATNLVGQAIDGDDTIDDAVRIRDGIKGEVTLARYVWCHRIPHEDIRKENGITIIPNNNAGGGEITRRVGSPKDDRILYDIMTNANESYLDRMEENWNELLWRQGATAIDVVGILGFVSPQMDGLCCGINRATEPAVQHLIFAGNDANSTLNGQDSLGAGGTVGSGGTALSQLTKFIRQLRIRAKTCGLPRGRFKGFGGSGWFDKYIYQANNYAGMRFNRDASGGGKVNLVLADEDVQIAKDFDLELDTTLDLLDTVASDEAGVGLSDLSVTVTGGGGTGAKFAVYVAADGTIDSVVVLNSGEGYTSAPTLTLANVGNGADGSITCTVYSASSGAGLTQVAADDVRIGKIATVTVANVGRGYTTTGTTNKFTDMLVVLYEPAWEYLVQTGLDFKLTIPADDPRKRAIEQQCDHCAAIKPLAMACNGIFQLT